MLPEIFTPIPGPRSLEAADVLRRFESRNVTYLADDYPIFWERAEGSNVWDADGNRFLDWTSAFGVTGLGHRNPKVCEALIRQSGLLLHAMGDVHPALLKARLCAKLSALTFERWGAGDGKVILGNSGFEAVEAALKTALLRTGKPGVIAFEGGYHGLGYGALEVVGTTYFREPFQAQLAKFGAILPFPTGEADIDALEAEMERVLKEHAIGAVLVEPIQGRGGERVPPSGFLQRLRAFCDRHGLVLILDEIYTGFNRTGALFACELSEVVPDLICLGKALTSGFPLSACVGRAEIMDAWPLSGGEALHTSTFLGNPLGCAMALASLAEHEKPETAIGVRERGDFLRRAFQAIRSPHIVEVRGVGLLIGMELSLDGGTVNQLVKRALQDGLILLQSGPAGNVLGFTPCFEVSDEEILFTAARLQDYLDGGAGFVGSIS